MIKTKGTGFVFLRAMFAQRGSEVENRYLAQLSPEEVTLYWQTLPITWLDIVSLSRMFEIAAKILFPDHPHPLREFARLEAHHALKGIYQVILRFTSVPMLMKQTAKLWNIYYEKGQALAEKQEGMNTASLIVENFPELPANNREIVLGYTIGTLELTGAKNIRGMIDDKNPERWRWTFTWE